MTSLSKHPSFDVLNDFVDGRLDQEARSDVAKHIEACAQCRRELHDLTALLESIGSVPASVRPPDDLWNQIRTSIDSRKQVVLPIGDSGQSVGGRATATHEAKRPWWASRSMLAAAAVFLIVASSGVTALVLRSGNTEIAVTPNNDAVQMVDSRMLPVSFRRAESEYLRTIAELRATLRSQRDVLRPETIAAVEHNLTVIDTAIEEARAALLSDPGNSTLVDLLTASYERKVDLLRRATDLGGRT